MDYQHFIINTPGLLDRLKSYCSKVSSNYLIFDVETDGTIEKLNKLYGLAICLNGSKAFYLVWRDKLGQIIWNDEQQKDIISWFNEFAKTKKIIGHNAIFDILILLNNWNIDLTDYLYHDTILSAHTINEEGPFGLKDLGQQYFGASAVEERDDLKENVKANGGSTTKTNFEMYKADTEILGKYSCKDVKLTHDLFQIFETKLKEEQLNKLFYEDEVMPLYREVTIPMKRYGFPIDLDHFNKLKVDITSEINKLKLLIMQEIKPQVEDFELEILDKEVPVSNKGNLPKELANLLNIPLPINAKTNKVTLSKKALELQAKANTEYSNFYNWIIGDKQVYEALTEEQLLEGRKQVYYKSKETDTIFNLNSGDHLREWLINVKGYTALDQTDTGKDKIDIEFLESLKGQDDLVDKLIDFKKLNKLLSTYIDGILDRQIDGVIYTSMLQFGTESGRFSSAKPNLQNLPRLKDEESNLSELVLKYVNSIRRGFIAGPGKDLIDADYAQLEVVCFAHKSEEPKLIKAIKDKEDIYSKVAIDVNNLGHKYSASKKAANYLKTHEPTLRQNWKPVVLGIVYGMEESRLSDTLKIDFNESKKIINSYLSTYPNLKKYMSKCNNQVKVKGFIKSELGRIRHLPKAKKLYEKYGDILLDYKYAKNNNLIKERREFKKYLNLAKNFPIQSLAASIVNRSSIAIAKAFKTKNLNAFIALQVHDELLIISNKEHSLKVKDIVRECMENTIKISIPLTAEPQIANNWADAK